MTLCVVNFFGAVILAAQLPRNPDRVGYDPVGEDWSGVIGLAEGLGNFLGGLALSTIVSFVVLLTILHLARRRSDHGQVVAVLGGTVLAATIAWVLVWLLFVATR